MIQLKDVSKIYTNGNRDTRPAVDGITLELPEQQVTVLKGPSGAGKTTLLALIGGMARPSTGRIYFDDKEITGLPERFLSRLRRSKVGFIFQNHNLLEGAGVLENVILPLLPAGCPTAQLRQKAMDLLSYLDIAPLALRRVRQLSGGEQQRVAIARALINDPALVIADEPTAHLDSDRSHQFMAIVADLKARGRTVLMASHDPLVYGHPVVDRVVTLRDGRMESGRAVP